MNKADKRYNKYFPWAIVLFFVVLAILDGIFVTIATSTHRGVVTKNAYKKGLEYNETIAASDRQNQLDWEGEINYQNNALIFELVDDKNKAIDDAIITAYFTRVTQDGHDFESNLEHSKNGTYKQNISFPLKGLWNVTIIARWQQQQYQQSKRIIVE